MAGLALIPAITGAIGGGGGVLGTIGTVASIAGTGMSLVGGLREASAIKAAGRAQQQQAEYQARQAEVAAGQERASSQRDAIEQRRRQLIAQSRARAVGASQGTTGDTSFLNILSGIAAEGGYASDFAMLEGERRASDFVGQADMLRYEGGNAAKAAKIESSAKRLSTITSAATDIGSLASKYADKPSTAPSTTERITWNDGTKRTYKRTGIYY